MHNWNFHLCIHFTIATIGSYCTSRIEVAMLSLDFESPKPQKSTSYPGTRRLKA